MKNSTKKVHQRVRDTTTKKLWTHEQKQELNQLGSIEKPDWEQIAKKFDKKPIVCKLMFEQVNDKLWNEEEENILREWWEFHDKDNKLNFKELQQQLSQHSIYGIQRRLLIMMAQGIYKNRFDLSKVCDK